MLQNTVCLLKSRKSSRPNIWNDAIHKAVKKNQTSYRLLKDAGSPNDINNALYAQKKNAEGFLWNTQRQAFAQ